jgi:hypothetical protein
MTEKRIEARKVGPDDVPRRPGPGMFYLFLGSLYTYIYICIIVHYDDTMARHDGEEGLNTSYYIRFGKFFLLLSFLMLTFLFYDNYDDSEVTS